VVEIRERWRKGETQEALGREFGISNAAVSMMVRGRTWADVPGVVGEGEAKEAKRGRAAGARQPKLSPAQVAEIRGMGHLKESQCRAVGALWGVHHSTIWRVARGKSFV
jgi:hypothetical protein